MKPNRLACSNSYNSKFGVSPIDIPTIKRRKSEEISWRNARRLIRDTEKAMNSRKIKLTVPGKYSRIPKTLTNTKDTSN